MDKYERNRERARKKWLKRKQKVIACTCGGNAELIKSMMRKWNRYYIECDICHWRSKKKPTIRLAIRAWNKDMRNYKKWYDEHVEDCEGEL